jgi:hypothetical protein
VSVAAWNCCALRMCVRWVVLKALAAGVSERVALAVWRWGRPWSTERGKLTSEEAEGDIPNSMTNTHATAPSLSKLSCCQTPLSSAQCAVIESRMRDCDKQAVLLELRPMS